jgi:diguanylate cyclase (GGDEF)-like protein
MAIALAGTLIVLAMVAVLGSWRQAELLQSVSDESARTTVYEAAADLAATEATLVQGALDEPAGEERTDLARAYRETLEAVRELTATDAVQAQVNARLVAGQEGLEPMVDRYLGLLDRGDQDVAQTFLEERLEPASQRVRLGLRAAANAQYQRYLTTLDQARHDSAWLHWGTLLIFVLGLAVLALVGWSNRAHRRAIERMAVLDALTGLPNRTAFQARADAAVSAVREGGPPPTVLMLDLDGFKEVNDNFGHHAGDLLLVEVARRLTRAVREQDTVARLGGDEFAVLIVDGDPGIGETAAARIGELFTQPFVIEGITLDIEVSVGMMTGDADHDTADLLRYADIAMYTAKEHRLGYIRFDTSQAHETASRLTLLGDLRRALDADDEIRLHYQPKISVDTGAVIGAEALARWQHPTRGMVPPNDFIPVLEGTSLIHRFTVRVLDLALEQARRWLDAGHRVPVAVNVSTRSLLDPSFVDTVAAALATAGVPGDLLCIEITENTVMADPDRAVGVLRRIRALGVSTSIDDFGTGYSSMAYLKILPVDEIKVDRSFVQDMATDHSNFVLVESTVDLGHNLGLTVVAEGVEDGPTVAALHDLGCDVAQGYHFARPLAADEFVDFLTRRVSV